MGEVENGDEVVAVRACAVGLQKLRQGPRCAQSCAVT
jgi:hypothetical protein